MSINLLIFRKGVTSCLQETNNVSYADSTDYRSFFIICPASSSDKGVVTLCEAGIYTTALLLGGPSGAIVGSLSSGMIDFLSGYPEWALLFYFDPWLPRLPYWSFFVTIPLLALSVWGSVTMILRLCRSNDHHEVWKLWSSVNFDSQSIAFKCFSVYW